MRASDDSDGEVKLDGGARAHVQLLPRGMAELSGSASFSGQAGTVKRVDAVDGSGHLTSAHEGPDAPRNRHAELGELPGSRSSDSLRYARRLAHPQDTQSLSARGLNDTGQQSEVTVPAVSSAVVAHVADAPLQDLSTASSIALPLAVSARSADDLNGTAAGTTTPAQPLNGASKEDLRLQGNEKPDSLMAGAVRAQPEPVAAPVKRVSVLLAEDHGPTAKLMSMNLRALGCEVTVADNGVMALDAVKRVRESCVPIKYCCRGNLCGDSV